MILILYWEVDKSDLFYFVFFIGDDFIVYIWRFIIVYFIGDYFDLGWKRMVVIIGGIFNIMNEEGRNMLVVIREGILYKN